MIPIPGVEGKTFAILGMGRTGMTSAMALQASDAKVVVWDDDLEARERAADAGFILRELVSKTSFKEVDKLIVSPGVPYLYPEPHPVVATASEMGVPLDNDIGLFFQAVSSEGFHGDRNPSTCVAITGSNGKSTTAALLHHVLKKIGRRSQITGNFGNGVLASGIPGDGEVMVLELSSYQAELASKLSPDIAVMLNLSPDHLDRHGGLGGYFAAKRRLFASEAIEKAVIGVDDPEGRFLASEFAGRRGTNSIVRISSSATCENPKSLTFYTKKGRLYETCRGTIHAPVDLRSLCGLPGNHNLFNACAVAAVCRILGIETSQAIEAMSTFHGLSHRMQRIAETRGVTFINDSKATNVASASRSLQAFRSIRWIAGGRAKEGGLSSLNDMVFNVSKAYYIGESADEFAAQINGVPFEICGNMATAVAAAVRDSREGDTVLLAPAAASFDQYSDFAARGNEFAAEVRRHID
ncbi:MAG: UDP-N-acetylmuramoyl-L-alanine--D-glutamate ligase [Albidovulum sp.]|nr:UDP-N-acetylmuramoyl-L-alanine--D-glutamate ligase [Albidovulum sp.]